MRKRMRSRAWERAREKVKQRKGKSLAQTRSWTWCIEHIDSVTIEFLGRDKIQRRARDLGHHRNNKGCLGLPSEV